LEIHKNTNLGIWGTTKGEFARNGMENKIIESLKENQ
jgi:hypothetical protein